MTYDEIQELNGTQPYSFESDREEQWYKCGLVEGADVAYKQAEKDFMEKAEKWWYEHLVGFLKEGLTEGVIAEFKQFMANN